MRLNPIVKKDVRVQARSMKMCWGVFAYELILAFVFFFAMLIIRQENRYSLNNIYSDMIALYPVLAVTQLIILGVVVPVRTASSISGEKERQTFDIMMTTSMTPFAVILGKVTTAIVQSMFFVVASLPIMALTFIIGGMSWSYLFWFLLVALLVSFFAAGIGILCSSLCRKSISAVIMSYGFYLVFFLATLMPCVLYEILRNDRYVTYNAGQTYSNFGENTYLFLLLNPIIYVAEFFGRILVGESLVENMMGTPQSGTLLGYLTSGYWWMVISTVMFLAVTVLFLWLAARRINPVSGKSAGRRSKAPKKRSKALERA